MNINEFDKSEVTKKQLEETKAKEKFDALTKQAKVKTNIGLLEEKALETLNLLEGFAIKIPLMIENIEAINQNMNTDEFKVMLTKLYNGVASITSNQVSLNKNMNELKTLTNEYLRNAEKRTEKILNTYNKKSSLGKMINWYIIIAFIILSFICGKTILSTQDNIKIVNKHMLDIHKILQEDKKYWYNTENKNLYLKETENSK